MMIEFLSRDYVIYLMGIICLLGFAGRLAAGKQCRKMCRQSEDLVLTNNRCLKQIRTRYESAYRLNKGRVNAQAVVSKQLGTYRVYGMRLRQLEAANRIAAQLCLLIAVAGFGVLFLNGQDILICAKVFFWGTGLAGLSLLLGCFFGTSGLEEVEDCLTDYLDNTLAGRMAMEQEQRAAGPVKGTMRDDLFMKKEEPAKEETSLEIYQDPAAQIAATVEKEKPVRETARKGRKLSERDEQLIADVLKEYLGGNYQ